jgi:hypothetical protein
VCKSSPVVRKIARPAFRFKPFRRKALSTEIFAERFTCPALPISNNRLATNLIQMFIGGD